jgi:hypothetical protein
VGCIIWQNGSFAIVWHDKYDVLFLSTSLKSEEIVEKKIGKGKERIKIPMQITIWNFSDQWQTTSVV